MINIRVDFNKLGEHKQGVDTTRIKLYVNDWHFSVIRPKYVG